MINSAPVPVRPPLGVTPKDIWRMQRVQELARAIYEYTASFEYVEKYKDNLASWSAELAELIQQGQ